MVNSWNNEKSAHIKIVHGTSKKIKHTIQDSFKQMTSHGTKDDDETCMRVEHNIKSLENDGMEASNDALNNIGHALEDKEKVAPANVWVAMADEAQLKVDQQCILNKHYYYVHGSRLT